MVGASRLQIVAIDLAPFSARDGFRGRGEEIRLFSRITRMEGISLRRSHLLVSVNGLERDIDAAYVAEVVWDILQCPCVSFFLTIWALPRSGS